MRVINILKNYFVKAVIVALYSIFFVTQQFSITPDIATSNGTIPFFYNHVYHTAIAKVNSAHNASITQKNVVGVRLNKRFHPAEWVFAYIRPGIELPFIFANDTAQKSFSSDEPVTSARLFSELLRGPPAVA
jgi:hypothetical protein